MRHVPRLCILAAMGSTLAWPGLALAEPTWPTVGFTSPGKLMALADQELTTVSLAGLDASVVNALQKTARSSRALLDEASRRRAEETAAAALHSAIEWQAKVAPQLAVTAVASVTTAAQLGSTLMTLNPATNLGAIGLPFFGLPVLSSRSR